METLPFILNDVPLRHIPEPFQSFFREIRLRMYGFDSGESVFEGENCYADYLNSKPWKRIRNRVLKRDNKKCFRCKGKATEVHHRSYDLPVLRGHADDQLSSICRGCHQFISFDGKRRRTLDEANAMLDAPYVPVEVPLLPYQVPVVNGRRNHRLLQMEHPPQWETMSDVERHSYTKRWFDEFMARAKERHAKKLAKVARAAQRALEKTASNIPPGDNGRAVGVE